MTYLVDVNVWMALAIVGHIHHSAAREWFEALEDDQLMFCRVTQTGFLRLLTNPAVMAANVLSAEAAWSVYDGFRKDSRIRFVEEPAQFEDAWRGATMDGRTGANFWTDAYLAAFAKSEDYTIVSFDRGFQRYDVPLRLLT